MGRDTDSGSQVFEEDNQDLKSISHNFSSLSGSVSNICWVNIKVSEALIIIKIIIFVLQGENPDSSPADDHRDVSGLDYIDDNNYSMKSDQVKSGRKRHIADH